MKKTIVKLSKIIAAFVMSALFVFADTQSVEAASSTIKLGKATLLPGYIAGVRYNIKTLKGGGYAYCLNLKKKTAQNMTQYYQYQMNAGIAYILENGYPNKKFTGNKNKDFYITQGAIWWYLDDTTGTSYLGKGYKSTGSDKYGLRKYIKKLVAGAKTAKKNGYSSPSVKASISTTKMSLDSGKKNYVSKAINANAKNITGKYTVSITSAPKGTYITNTSGSKQTSFKSNEKFIVKIPASSIAEGKTVTAKVKITASSTINKAYKYAPKNNSIQPMVVLQPYTKKVTSTISVKATKPKTPKACSKEGNKYYGKDGKEVTEEQYYNQCTTSKVTIQKLDRDTNAAVAGATLVVKNSGGSVVKTITTTTSATEITGLAIGTYTVEETKAPAGYKLSTDKQTFKITTKNRNITVKYYNTKIQPCSKDGDKYYGKDGSEVTEEEYSNQCTDSKATIIKLDKDTNEAVAGATLVVKNEDGSVVKTFTTTTSAYDITGLDNGTYTVEETKAPNGYQLSTEQEEFTISKDSRYATVRFYNEKVKTCSYDESTDTYYGKDGSVVTEEEYSNQCTESEVVIYKLDKNTENPIAGATLVVKDANGNEIKKFTSTTNGYSITGLSNGTYTVEEEEAPEGYEISTAKETFTLSSSSRKVEVKFYNTPKDRVVTITKVDSVTGKTVAGAVIVVTNENGEEVARFTSTNSAYVLNNLADGTYTVEEEEAPEGYFLNEESQTFTIDSTHLSYQVTIKDVPKTCENGGKDEDECSVEVPNTGSTGMPFYLIGIAIISSGIAYVYKNNKKAYQK